MENQAIVVLYYNKVSLTRRCINSILESGYLPRQIFCFSNGSKEEFFFQLKSAYPELNHLNRPGNTGFSGGFNDSLKAVFKENFQGALFLTNDTIITANCLEQCVKKAGKTNAGMIAPRIDYSFKPGSIDSIGGFFDPVNITLHHYQAKGLPQLLNSNTDYIPGTAVYITRAAFEELKGTDEDYFMYWEDVDLSFRAHQAGIKQARCYEARILHGVGQTCHKKPIYTTYYYNRNRIRFCEKIFQGNALIQAKKKIEKELLKLYRKHVEKKDSARLKYTAELIQFLKDC